MDNDQAKAEESLQKLPLGIDKNLQKPPLQRLSLGSDIEIPKAKINTPMRRSTQAYYDSQLENHQNRSRKGTNRSRQLSLTLKNPRLFRLQLSFLPHPDESRQFFVYWVATKQSNSGIFSHERLFIIDSLKQSIMYYSDIPQLPLKSVSALKTPKQVVSLSKKNKVSLTASSHIIGGVSLSWFSAEGRKSWFLTLGSRQMVRQLGSLIESVRNHSYSDFREVKTKIAGVEQPVNRSRINTTTKFISQIKQLQNRGSSQHSLDPSKISTRKNSPKTEFKTIEYKKFKKDSSGICEPSRLLSSKSQVYKEHQHLKNPSQRKVRELKVEQTKQNKPQQKQKKHSKSFLEQLLQKSYQQSQHITSATTQPRKQASSLDKIIRERKNSRNGIVKPEESNRLSMSKIAVNKISFEVPQTPIKERTSVQLRSSRKRQKIFNQKSEQKNTSSSKNIEKEKEKINRQILLQERRQTYPVAKTNTENYLDYRHYENLYQSSASTSLQHQPWLKHWLEAQTHQQFTSIYQKFVDHCTYVVYRFVNSVQNQQQRDSPFETSNTFSQGSIDYTYFMLIKGIHQQKAISAEQRYLKQYNEMNYLFSCLQLKDLANNCLAFPLSCVVVLKGFKVFCSARIVEDHIKINKTLVKQKYEQVMDEYEKIVKVNLRCCDCLQLFINNRSYLYFRECPILPNLQYSSSYIDGNYIKVFVKDGIINSNQDIQIISNHITRQLFPLALKEIEQKSLISRTQLLSLLTKYELNQSMIKQLYQQSKERQYCRASALIMSEIVAKLLEEHIRQCYQNQIIHNTKSNTIKKEPEGIKPVTFEEVIFQQIKDWLQQNPPLLELLHIKLKRFFTHEQVIKTTDICDQYLLTSLFERLGIRPQVKYRMAMSLLEKEKTRFWRQVQFNPNNFNINFIHSTLLYDEQIFLNSYNKLNSELFIKQTPEESTKIQLTQKQVQQFFNHSQANPFHLSPSFKLLTRQHKIKLHYFLSHNQKVKKKRLVPSYSQQDSCFYFNLLYHPTAFIVNVFDFEQSLIGIRWLIKQKQYYQASAKIQEQIYRILIWGKHKIASLIQLYDLKSSLSLKMNQQTQSITSCLKALKLAIQLFNKTQDVSWQFIWDRAFLAAHVHYTFQKYEKAVQFYESCQQLVEKASEQELINQQIHPQFVQIYHRKAMLNLILCKIPQTMTICQSNLKKYNYLAKLLQNHNKKIVQRIGKLQFEAHLLILRCLQIQNNQKGMLEKVGWCLSNSIEHQIKLGLNTLKGDEFRRYKMIELSKYAWMAIIYNKDDLNNEPSEVKNTIDLTQIDQKLQTYHFEDRETPRYTEQETYNYFSLIFSKHLNNPQPQTLQGSVILRHLRKVLQDLSVQGKEDNISIYDQQCTQSSSLFLQCFVEIISYSFALGTLRVVNQQEIW